MFYDASTTRGNHFSSTSTKFIFIDVGFFMTKIGSVTLDELMTGLMSAHDTFQQAMDIEIREEVIIVAL